MDEYEDTGLKPAVIDDLRARARQFGIRRLVLFGSRARGDHRRESDIDLAVSGGDQVRFGLEVEDETPTLLEFDFVDLDAPITDELRAMIQRDGRLIYEEI